jgi:hypothetical protein
VLVLDVQQMLLDCKPCAGSRCIAGINASLCWVELQSTLYATLSASQCTRRACVPPVDVHAARCAVWWWCCCCPCAALLQVGAAQRYGLNGRGTRVCVLDNSIGKLRYAALLS